MDGWIGIVEWIRVWCVDVNGNSPVLLALVQRDGSSLASGSEFYGSRVAVAAAPKTSVVPTQRNMRVRAVTAPPQPHQRSPASTGAVSLQLCNFWMAAARSQVSIHFNL